MTGTIAPAAHTAIVPCLDGGMIAAAAAARAIAAADRLGPARWASHARAWTVALLFDAMECAFASDREPTEAINEALDRIAAFADAAADAGFARLGAPDAAADAGAAAADIAETTGAHYGPLFQAFSSTAFWEEPARLLRTRLERNGIPLDRIRGATVLDSGCGGGRYSAAWHLLGAGPVTGIDVSPTGIADARERVTQAGISGVSFQEGSVLALPFGDDSFDIVFSNGVLHHTTDWRAGITELVRVLKPGGLGWLYLIERPGGLFWDVIEVLRVIMRDEHPEVARAALHSLGLPANRVFYVLDHVMVPINLRLTPEEVESALAGAGATAVRRLVRGADFDRIERIHQNAPHARVTYGVGENRYVFSKV